MTDSLSVSTDKENRGDGGDGCRIQSLSFHKRAMPLVVKNVLMLSDETATERNGEKYLLLSNGGKKARPRPLVVMASRTPWEPVAEKESRPSLL